MSDAADLPSRAQRGRRWLKGFQPAPLAVDARERWRAAFGALLGLLFTGALSRVLPHDPAVPWLVAPLGASAVLVFAVPGSPLTQPWSVVGGNTASALVGIACARAIGDPVLAASVAVGAAIALMFVLRCLHPPGGATALLMVLTHTLDWQVAASPVLLNSSLLVLTGIAYNSLTGRPYPHRAAPPTPRAETGRFTSADLDAALKHYNQVLDVSRDDLEELLEHAEAAAYRRHLKDVRCADIMTRDLVTVQFGTSLQEAWSLMRQHGIKALPVTDRTRRVVGILTRADFMRHIELDGPRGLAQRLLAFVTPSGRSHSDRPEVVGQIMTRQVRVASADRPIAELAPMFTEAGHHHIPIVEDGNRLVGIITQSDFVRALYRAVSGPAPA